MSNLEQPITTLKSRMGGYHRLSMKRCVPRFQRKHLAKIISAGSKRRPQASRASQGRQSNVRLFEKSAYLCSGQHSGLGVFYPDWPGKGYSHLKARQGSCCGILGEGQFFGEQCLSGQPLRTTSMTALTDCRITSITRAALITAIHDEPRFSELFMNHLLSRNSRIEEDVIDQLFNSSEKRLARLLLLLANYGKEGNPPIVPVTLSQETLAEMIGTTRSRVSFFMNKFRRLGLIDYNGKIDVHQSLLNSVLHDKPEIREDEFA
jgi:CRP/FNR family transcriptional regulator, cyclic AMP receptor protein